MPVPFDPATGAWPAYTLVAIYAIDRLSKLVRYAYQRTNGGTPDQKLLSVQREIDRKQELMLAELRILNDKHQTRSQTCAYEEHHEHIKESLARIEGKS